MKIIYTIPTLPLVEFGWEEKYELLQSYGRPEIYDASHNDIYIDIENNKIETMILRPFLWNMIKDNNTFYW